ncbi:hypothetical protein DOT_0408 [Desulfosporosinus sp. OT]|nr:hypothetical protein DOT_0408 [Desulfosporosinus sp. OT]
MQEIKDNGGIRRRKDQLELNVGWLGLIGDSKFPAARSNLACNAYVLFRIGALTMLTTTAG